MTPEEQSQAHKIDSLFSTNIKLITNGFLLRTKSGVYYYKTTSELLKAVGDYVEVLRKDYEKVVIKKEATNA